MKKIFMILLGLLGASSAGSVNEKLLLTGKNIETAKRISRCMKKGARALFAPSNDVSIIIPNHNHNTDRIQDCLDGSFANRGVKIFTQFPNDSNNESRLFKKETSFVLIEDKVNLGEIMEHYFVNRWAEYIIVTEATTQWISEFARYLWNLGFVKVAFVRVTSNESGILLRLIRNLSSQKSLPTLAIYDLCNEGSASPGSERNHRVSNVIHPFSSLLHTPINATVKYMRILEGIGKERDFGKGTSTGKITSLGIDVLKIFATKNNMELIRHQWKNQSRSNWSDTMYRCVAGDADFFFSPLPPSTSFSYGFVDAVTWYKYETLLFVDSLKFSLHTLKGLVMPFDLESWICIFSLTAIFGIFAYVIDIMYHRGLIRQRITVLMIWAIFVLQSRPGFPVKFGLRFVLIIWLLHNLNTSTLYTARFSSTLTTTDPGNLLRTFQDILDSGRPVCASSKVEELFNDTTDSQMHAIFNRLELVTPQHAFSEIFNRACISSHLRSYLKKHNWENRKNQSLRLYALAEAVILTYPSLYYAKRHNPNSKEFERIVSIVRDAGIIRHLNDLYSRNVEKTVNEMVPTTTDGEFLKLKHLTVLFNILVIGHLISGVAFIIEYYVHRRLSNQLD